MKLFSLKSGLYLWIVFCFPVIDTCAQTHVVLDNYYNHETDKKSGKLYHYLWSDHANSGFSEWGKIFKEKGVITDTLQREPSANNLKQAGIYIIVDPDTKAETPAPHYLEKDGIEAIVHWVKAGGVLVLMANDSANCEFQHLNDLAEHFGLHFNEVTLNHVEGTNWEMGAITHLPASPIFKGVNKIYLKDVSSLELKAPAKSVLTKDGNVFIAESHTGKGYVIAVTDPWIYNEYIGHKYLPESFDNYKAAENFTDYLISLSKKARR